MQSRFLIIAFLIISLLGAFRLKANSQIEVHGSNEGNYSKIVSYSDSTLIADETWITYSKTGARIVTFSEKVFQDISLKWGKEFKSINIIHKYDDDVHTKEYNIYVSRETGNNIKQWAKKNL